LIKTRNNRASADEQEEIPMNGKIAFFALALTTALSILGAASAAAGEHRDRGDDRGAVLPCSLAGVNPVYHPDIFGNPAVAAYAYGFVQSRGGAWQVAPGCRR
jgi:hypothetical protein